MATPFAAPRFMLSHRSDQAEVMDEPGLSPPEYRRCLRELAQVNRLTLTHRPVLRWLERTLSLSLQRRERVGVRGRPVVILDVAFGQGDLLRAIGRWAKERGIDVSLHGIDLNPRSAVMARESTSPGLDIDYQTGDVFTFEPARRPDFIVSSQFTHHLPDAEVTRFVRWLEEHARLGWFLTDLERSPLAWRAFPLLCAVAGWNEIIRHDGQVSIARGFLRDEWEQLVADAGVHAEVRRSFPFRLNITNKG